MQAQSLPMINVCTCIRVLPTGGCERGMPPPPNLRQLKIAYPHSLGKIPPKPNFYSSPSKGASPTTQ